MGCVGSGENGVLLGMNFRMGGGAILAYGTWLCIGSVFPHTSFRSFLRPNVPMRY